MPTYGYECTKCKEQFEVIQRMTEDALSVHDDCGGELRRLLYPVGIVFKGSGFHVNDYGKHGINPAKSSASTKTETKVGAATETKSETKGESKAAETKTETKTETAAASAKTD